MNLAKKLDRWQQQGMIDSTTSTKIQDYERQQPKPIALWAFGGLGVLTILLGLISIVASNWVNTPIWAKLAVDLVLCLVIAAGLYRVIVREDSEHATKLWLRELLVIFYYGFILASMALIGQSYQLGGSIATLLLVWTIITLPVVLLGRGKFLAALWTIGMVATYILNIEVLFNYLDDLFKSSAWFLSSPSYSLYLSWLKATVVAVYALTPLFFISLSRVPWLTKQRAVMADALSTYSWLAIIIMGWFSQFLWYQRIHSSDYDEIKVFLGICFFAFSIMVFFIPRLYPQRTAEIHLTMRIVLITIFILVATALWHTAPVNVIGALSNVLYMLVIAWAALKIQSIRLFNLMIALICLRLLAVYLEVFGSMLETGIGLVIGGILTLAIVWIWFKKANSVARYFGLTRSDRA